MSVDVQRIRNDFRMNDDFIWFQSAAVNLPPPFLLETVNQWLEKQRTSYVQRKFGWEKSIENFWTRTCGQFLNCAPNELAGIVCTTHGLNIAAAGLGLQAGENVVLNEFEYLSIPQVFRYHAEKAGAEIRIARRKEWEIPVENIAELIDEQTRAVVISHVAFTNGFKHEVLKLAKVCHTRNILLIVDAIQSYGVCPIDVQEMDIDILIAGGHKWVSSFAGFGILYIKKSLIEHLEYPFVGIRAIQNPAAYQHDYTNTLDFVKYYPVDDASIHRFEFSTENLVGRIAFGTITQYWMDMGIHAIYQRVLHLTDYCLERLRESGFEIRSSQNPVHRSGIINFRTAEDPGDCMRRLIQDHLIYTSVRGGGIRIALHAFNTEKEIDALISACLRHK